MKTYWEKRALAIKTDALNLANAAEQKIRKEYARAANATLKEYTALVKPWREADGSYNIEGIKRAYRVNPAFKIKFQRLSSHLNDYLNKIGKNEQTIINQVLLDVYKATDIAVLNKTWNLLHEKAVKRVIETPWTSDGINYSTRIWRNVNQLKAEMQDIMLDSVMKGQNPRKTAKRIVEKFDVGVHQAERLVRTETMAIYTKAAHESYEELGVEQYEILGDPDDHMCEPSGTRHFMYEFDEGHTAPPYHPNCKCCIIPIVD